MSERVYDNDETILESPDQDKGSTAIDQDSRDKTDKAEPPKQEFVWPELYKD